MILPVRAFDGACGANLTRYFAGKMSTITGRGGAGAVWAARMCRSSVAKIAIAAPMARQAARSARATQRP